MEVQADETVNDPAWRRALWISLGLTLIWNIISWSFPFFWDNILNSRIAHWYLADGFSRLVVPEELDAGHPPFFSLYIAGLWKVFGRALWVAHLGMLPFLGAVVWSWWSLCGRFLKGNMRYGGLAILALEPTYLAQSSMVTPDIVLLAGFLVGLVLICGGVRMEGKKIWLIPVTILMCAASTRGILMVPALYLVDRIWSGNMRSASLWLTSMRWYVPAGIFAIAWLGYHWQVQGWLLTPPPETYGGHREVLGIAGIARNIGLVGWRWLDYGRIFYWVFLGVALLVGGRKLLRAPQWRKSVLLWAIPSLWLLLLMVPFSNPIGHRYFLVGFLLMGLVVLNAVDILETKWRRWLVPALLGIGLVTGNLWIYPAKIAQGWDATLAHIRYFSLRENIETALPINIPVAGAFPMLSNADVIYARDLNRTQLVSKEGKQLSDFEFILESNISNGFSDEELEILKTKDWKVTAEEECGGVYIRLYRRNRPNE